RMKCDKSMSLLIADYVNGSFYISGQHEQVIIVRNDGELEEIDTIDLGFPIGLDADISDFISAQKVELNSGDMMVLYTDGITEAENINKQFYGLERLINLVQKNHHKSAQEIRQTVIDDVINYIGEQTVFDDITLLVIKKK
ncbi:MAG TPA: SpoIIE family protein phosphatase, partial [Allocoleopsis sp.]